MATGGRGRGGAVLCAVAAGVVGIAAHAFAIGMAFHADDYNFISTVCRALDGGPAPAAPGAADGAAPFNGGRSGLFRPVLDAVHVGILAARGRDAGGALKPSPLPEHVVSIVLRGLTAAATVFAALRLGATLRGAFLAGLVAAIHAEPMNATVWIAARGDLLWPLFCLLAWLGFDAALRAAAPPGAVRRLTLLATSLVLCVLATCSKETGFLGVALVVVALACGGIGRRYPTKRVIVGAGVAAAGVAIGVGARLAFFGNMALRYVGDDGLGGVDDIRKFVCDSIPTVWIQLLSGRLAEAGAHPLESLAQWAAVAAVVAWLVAGTALAPRRSPVAPVILAIGAASLYPLVLIPHYLFGDSDFYRSRFMGGWTIALALALGLGASGGRLARTIQYAALVAVAACFALEAAETVEIDRGFRRVRDEIGAALASAGPDADLVMVPPASMAGSLLAPTWAIPAALQPPFNPRRGRSAIVASAERALRTRRPDDPRRLWIGGGRAVVLALGRPEAGFVPSFDLKRVGEEADAGSADGTLRGVLASPDRAVFALDAAALAGHPILRFTATGRGHAMLRCTAGGTTISTAVVLGPEPCSRALFLRSPAWPANPDVRSLALSLESGSLMSAELGRDADLIAIESPGDNTHMSRSREEAEIVVVDRAHWPILECVWEARWTAEPVSVRYPYCADCMLRGAEPRRVALTRALAAPANVPRPFAALSSDVFERETVGSGRTALPFAVRVEARATAEGPVLASSEPVLLFVER